MSSGSRPNIVLILADDLGFSDIGCFGGEIPTPTSMRSRPTVFGSRSSTTPPGARLPERRSSRACIRIRPAWESSRATIGPPVMPEPSTTSA